MTSQQRILVLTVACAAALVRVPVVPWAQTETPQTQEQVASPETDAIATSDVAPEAARTRARLKEIQENIQPGDAEKEIAGLLPEVTASLSVMLADTAGFRPERLAERDVRDQRRRWLRYDAQIDSWQSVMRHSGEDLEAERAELRELGKVWEQTRSKAASAGDPDVLLQQIDQVIADIHDMETRLSDRVGEVVNLQAQIADLKVSVGETLARLEGSQERLRGRKLSIDSPPLWKAGRPGLGTSLAGQVVDSFHKDVAALQEFVRAYGERIFWHVLLFVGLVVVMMTSYFRNRKSAHEETVPNPSEYVLSRPIAASVLLALVAWRWFYPEAPDVVLSVVGVTGLIPVLLLANGIAGPRERLALYGLAALFVLDKAHELALENSLLQRLLIVVISGGATALAIWYLRSVSRPSRPWARALAGLGRIGTVLLATAFVANVVGAVSLAETLTFGILASVYLAVALIIAVLALEGLATRIIKSRSAQGFRTARTHAGVIRKRTSTILRLAAVLIWLARTATAFDIAGASSSAIASFLQFRLTAGSFSISIGAIVTFFVAVWIALLVSRFVRFVLEDELFPRIRLPRGVPGAMSRLSHYAIVGIGVMVALSAAGFELSRLTLLAGALGVGIGFGLQNIVNNFVSGLILLLEGPIQVGDAVEVGPLLGRVRRIGMRSSVIHTVEGAEVIVPNANLVSNEVINWTMSDRNRRLDVNVGVAYGTDPHKVIDLLTAVGKDHEDVLDHPEPVVLFTGFGESSLDFVARYWTNRFDRWVNIKSELTLLVHDALNNAGIVIPFPQRDLHVKSADAPAGVVSNPTKAAVADTDGRADDSP